MTYEMLIQYPPGIQGPGHPNPGRSYQGKRTRCYIPDTDLGRVVVWRICAAFARALLFTVGADDISGEYDKVRFSAIHLKTRKQGGAELHAYPDADYLDRVSLELDEHQVPRPNESSLLALKTCQDDQVVSAIWHPQAMHQPRFSIPSGSSFDVDASTWFELHPDTNSWTTPEIPIPKSMSLNMPLACKLEKIFELVSAHVSKPVNSLCFYAKVIVKGTPTTKWVYAKQTLAELRFADRAHPVLWYRLRREKTARQSTSSSGQSEKRCQRLVPTEMEGKAAEASSHAASSSKKRFLPVACKEEIGDASGGPGIDDTSSSNSSSCWKPVRRLRRKTAEPGWVLRSESGP